MDRDDLQVSLVLNGGVSLAVWMSGAVLELDRARSVPLREDERASTLDRIVGAMLDLTERRVVIDLVAGASAGGINGAFLAAAIANGVRLDREFLLETWLLIGDAATLLRTTVEDRPPSLLMGERMRTTLVDVITQIVGGGAKVPEGAPTNVSLILTATDLHGVERRVGADETTGSPYREHRLLLKFAKPARPDSGALVGSDPSVAAELALAGRTSASFPAAFEAGELLARPWVRTADDEAVPFAGARMRRAIDGGVLDNSPFTPMLNQIDRRPTGADLDRTFVFVTPYDEEPEPEPTAPGDVPGAVDLAVRSLALKGELAGLLNLSRFAEQTARYGRSRQTRVKCDLLLGARPDELVALAKAMLPAYRTMRWRSAVPGLAGLPTEAPWLPDDVVASLDRWNWGAAPIRRLGAFAAVGLASARGAIEGASDRGRGLRRSLLRAEREVREVLTDLSTAELARSAESEVPHGGPDARAAAINASWTPERRRAYADWFWRLVDLLAASRGEIAGSGSPGAAAAIAALGVPEQPTRRRLAHLLLAAEVALETGDREATTGAEVRPRMRLVTLQGGSSGGRPLLLVKHALGEPGRPLRAKDVLLGMSLARFGGFLFRSWRANDWMLGRLHAATALSQTVLSLDRLREIGGATAISDGRPDRFAETLLQDLDEDAVDALNALVGPGRTLVELVSSALRHDATPASVRLLQDVVAWRIQVEVLREELPTVWREVRADRALGASMPARLKGLPETDQPPSAAVALAAFADYDLPAIAGLKRQWLSSPVTALIGRLVLVARQALTRPLATDTPAHWLRVVRGPARAALRVVRVWAAVPAWVAGRLRGALIPAALRSLLVLGLIAFLLGPGGGGAMTLLGAIAVLTVGLPWTASLGASLHAFGRALPGRLRRALVPVALACVGVLLGVATRRAVPDEPYVVIALLGGWLAAMEWLGRMEERRGYESWPWSTPGSR